jgi:serine/threonine-protein kinase
VQGRTVGSYRVTELLGEGGMGAVYRAVHLTLGRKAAVKVLLEELSHNKDVVARFFNEARAATAIDHPGIVSVFDFGYADDGCAYIIMEYLEGESLGDRRRREGRLPVEQVLTLGRQVAGALGAAHKQGIVHRDLKPDNIMVVPDPDVLGGERAKILDFGIAKLLDRESDTLPGVQTKSGRIMGTPAYMAPEQCRGAGKVDARADIYALGCVLYALVCGQPPFVFEGTGDLIAAHLNLPPPAPRLWVPDLPQAVEDVLLRLLAKRPEDRYATMAEVVEALEAASAGKLPARLGVKQAPPPAAKPADPTMLLPTVPARPPQPTTTLGTAVGQSVSSAPARRAWRLPAALGAAAVAAAIGVLAWRNGSATRSAPAATAAASAAAAAPARAPAAASAAPADVTLGLTSEPSGADVYRASDGIRLGATPLSKTFPRTDGEARFIVKHAGFEDQAVTLSAAADGTLAVTLRPLAPPPPGRSGGEHARRHAAARAEGEPAPASAAPPPRTAERPGKARPVEDGALDPYAQ